MNTIAWNYYALGSALCVLAQFIIILILLARQRRKKREIQALRASERMYRSLTENAEDVIARLAPDGRILYISPACQDVFGYAPDDILEQGADPLVHPDDLEHTWDTIYKAEAAGSDHYCVQNRLRHKQGHWIWAEVRGRLLYVSPGERAEIHCLIRDMTDLKQAEDALRASEEKFRALFSLLPVVSSVSSFQEGRILDVNEAFLQTLGFQRDDVLGKTAAELNLLADPAERAKLLETFQQCGSVRDREIDIRAKSGAVLNTLFSCEAVEIGGQQCLITAIMDITERKRNEEALRESEAKFRTIFENAPVTMTISRTEDGTYLDVNQRFVESTRLSKEDIIGKKSSDGLIDILEESDSNPLTPSEHAQASQKSGYYLAPADFEYIEQEYRSLGKLENFYFRSVTGDGTIVHNLLSAYPLTLQGELCTLSIITDITELKEAEEDLREREEKYHVLFDNMTQGVMYLGTDGIFEEANAAAFEIFGASPDASVEQTSLSTPLKVIREDGSELSIEEWPAVLAMKTGEPVRNMTVGMYLPQKQDNVWLTITAIPQFNLGETRPYRVFTIFHDVTDLKRVEQELRAYQGQLEELVEGRTIELQREIAAREQMEQSLRESEAQYRLIAENASDVIWTTNSARQFTYISPSVQRLSGYTPEEAMQLTYEQTMTPESWKQVADVVARADTDEQGTLHFEAEQIRKDGSIYWADIVVKRFYNAAGEHTGSLGISRDISERKQSENTLKQAKEDAEAAQRASEAANLAKSMFLSNMSHELRTPLNAILGFAQLLARETTLSPEQKDYLDTINRSGEHLLQLINDVLDMSKIEAGRMSVNHSRFDLWHMLANVEEMMRLRAEQKGLEFSVEHPADMPCHIVTDEKKLRQILINVLGNAVKFTQKGSVNVRISDCEFRNSEDHQSEFRNLKFEIEDTGPGIAQEDLSAIFEAFRQTSRGQDNEGTGLGLAISRKFAQLLGGDIQVVSELGRGSRFSIAIQVEPAEPDSVEPALSTGMVAGLASPQSPVRILVVDDHAESRQLIALLLGDVGFDVNEATNGREVLTLLEEWTPDLILMDMRMPVMDGYETTLRIRKRENGERQNVNGERQAEDTLPPAPFATPHIPIIALTASVFEEEQQQILAAGCDMLLRKPVSAPELFEAIRSYLGVEYVYAENEGLLETRQSKGNESALTPDALATLPEAVLDNLKQAVISGKQVLMTETVEIVREYDPVLADSIAHLVHNFKYQAIWKMIQQIQPTGRTER